jgi:hypothetical protein
MGVGWVLLRNNRSLPELKYLLEFMLLLEVKLSFCLL